MHGQIPSRHLAAILIADLVGYSRLVGIDEAGTLRRLRALRRELLDPAIASADGRVVKSTGDGIIAEFPSSVRAVSCAVAIQKAMAARPTGELTDRALQLRIGINLGDVIVEPDGDLLGDGVNVAARLEPLSDPGGLCISRSVYEQVRDKLSYPFEDRGDQELKNIARPVGVYALGPEVVGGLGEDDGDGASVPERAARSQGQARAAVALGLTALVGAGGLVWWSWRSVPASAPIPTLPAQAVGDARPAPRLSIVVLPFSNLSDEQGQEFLAESITTDLTTDLSRISGSFVIASGTALSYKGRSPDVRQVGRDLGVRYVLAGSVRRIGDLVRVNAQLADAATGAQVWSDRFEGSRAGFGDLQDELIARLARTLDLELTEAESRRAEKERPGNLDAGDVALRAWSVLNRPVSKAQLVEAQGLFEQALRLDPSLTSARIGLARTLANKVNIRVSDTNEADLARAEALNDDVLAAHPADAMAHFVKADILRGRKQFTAAVAGYQTAIALNRNFAPAYGAMASALLRAGRSPEAIPQVDHAVRLSPRDPLLGFWLYIKGHAYAHLARDEDAIAWCLKSLAASATPYWLNYVDLASSYAWLGRPDEARAAVDALLRLKPGYTVSQWRREGWSDDPVFLQEYQRIVEGLRKAGLPET